MPVPQPEQADKFTWTSFTVVTPKAKALAYRDKLNTTRLDLEFNPDQPRDEAGRWSGGVASRMAVLKAKYPVVAENYAKHSGTEMGSIEAHTGDVGREWETQLSPEQLSGISERFGSDVQRLMESAIPLHDIGKPGAIASGNKRDQHAYTVPIMQDVLRKEGFRDKDIALATELVNHDKLGDLVRRRSRDTAEVVAEKLDAKAQKVGMSTKDFATLQVAFYNADAAAYPYIQQFMEQEPSGKWTFELAQQLAPIVALTQASTRHLSTYDVPAFDLGDVEGHPFRGNQWTAGKAGGKATAIPAGKEGECFRNAGRFVRQRDGYVLVHGKVTNGAGRRLDHAWAETPTHVADPTTGVQMDKDRWYGLMKAEPEAKYSAEQSTVNMLRTGNLGPWTPEEVGTRHLRHDLGGEGSGNYGHAGRPGEVGGSAKTEGTQGLKFRDMTEDERDEFAVMSQAAKVGEKKDGGKVIVNTKVKGAQSQVAVEHAVFGKRDPADVVGQMVEDLPGNLRASWQYTDANSDKSIPPGGTALRMYVRGERINFTRTFIREADGTLTVHHDVFELPKALQGKGVAKAVLADSYQTYRELGVDKIVTLANLDRGAYAWAKFGFKADRPATLATMLTENLKGRPATDRRVAKDSTLPDLTPSQRANMLAVIAQHKDDPKLPWHVANMVTAEGRQVGKELLYDSSWFAKLDMHDRESTAKLEAYVKGH